jgi:hypothetical protein
MRATLAILAVTVALIGCSDGGRKVTYSSNEMWGRVIDAETKQGLAGVNVVVAWQVAGGLEGHNIVGWFKTVETTSNSAGYFSFPAWGPETKRVKGTLNEEGPVLVLFKSGYYLAVRRHASIDLRDVTAGLYQAKQGMDEYALQLSIAVDTAIDMLLGKEPCNWKNIPRFIHAIDDQNNDFKRNGTRAHMRSLDYLADLYKDPNCGDLKRYVEEKAK